MADRRLEWNAYGSAGVRWYCSVCGWELIARDQKELNQAVLAVPQQFAHHQCKSHPPRKSPSKTKNNPRAA
jgi:hypothetical protein